MSRVVKSKLLSMSFESMKDGIILGMNTDEMYMMPSLLNKWMVSALFLSKVEYDDADDTRSMAKQKEVLNQDNGCR
jgi:hypothetical protein